MVDHTEVYILVFIYIYVKTAYHPQQKAISEAQIFYALQPFTSSCVRVYIAKYSSVTEII